MYALTICSISENLAGEFIFLTDNTARLHSVLVDLHQVVGQVAQLWLHALWKYSLSSVTELKNCFNYLCLLSFRPLSTLWNNLGAQVKRHFLNG